MEEYTLDAGKHMSNKQDLSKESFINNKMKKEEMAYIFCNYLLCLKWRDICYAVAISTCYWATLSNIVVHYRSDAMTKSKPDDKRKPDVIFDYSGYITGVERIGWLQTTEVKNSSRTNYWSGGGKLWFIFIFDISCKCVPTVLQEKKINELKISWLHNTHW